MRWLILILVVGVLGVGAFLALKPPSGSVSANGPLRVTATIFPVAEWLREIAGGDVDVHLLCGGVSNPHHFEPKPQDIAAVTQSRAVFAVGLGLDEWSHKLVENAGGTSIQLFETGEWIKPRKLAVTTIDPEKKAGAKGDAKHDPHEGHDHAGHDHHHHGDEDPHFWLDPQRAKTVVARLAVELGKISPKSAQAFTQRAEAYTKKLNELDAKLKLAAKNNPERRKLVTFHDAYGYLFERLNMEVAAVVQVSPGVEPATRDFSVAIAKMKEIGQKTVFTEPAGNPKVAQMLAQEVGGTTALLDPLDTEFSEAGKTYIERMLYNLKTLVPQAFSAEAKP